MRGAFVLESMGSSRAVFYDGHMNFFHREINEAAVKRPYRPPNWRFGTTIAKEESCSIEQGSQLFFSVSHKPHIYNAFKESYIFLCAVLALLGISPRIHGIEKRFSKKCQNT